MKTDQFERLLRELDNEPRALAECVRYVIRQGIEPPDELTEFNRRHLFEAVLLERVKRLKRSLLDPAPITADPALWAARMHMLYDQGGAVVTLKGPNKPHIWGRKTLVLRQLNLVGNVSADAAMLCGNGNDKTWQAVTIEHAISMCPTIRMIEIVNQASPRHFFARVRIKADWSICQRCCDGLRRPLRNFGLNYTGASWGPKLNAVPVRVQFPDPNPPQKELF